MAYTIYSFSGVLIPQHAGKGGMFDVGGGRQTSHPSRVGAGIVHHPLIPLPGGEVFDPLGGVTAKRSTMDLTVKTNLLSSDGTLKSQLDAWLALQGKSGLLVRKGDDANVYQATARLVQIDVNREYQHRRFLPITFIWTVTGLPWAGAGQVVSLGGASPRGVTATNNGNVAQKVGLFVVSSAASMSNLSFVNNTTGHTMLFNGTVAAGKVLTINFGARSVINDVSDAYASFVPPPNFEEWFALAPGANSIGVGWTGGAMTAGSQIAWSDAWG